MCVCAPQLDEYDMMVRQLGFEMKAQPSEKLKSEEELAREERERLQKLEVFDPPTVSSIQTSTRLQGERSWCAHACLC